MTILSSVTLSTKASALIRTVTKSIIAKLVVQKITGQRLVLRSQPAEVVRLLKDNDGSVWEALR